MHFREVLDSQLCEEALRQVLESRTFGRSEQLRNFLKYVGYKTILGRQAEIKEYAIGVDALGKKVDYSPADDSSVRRRAYEIRQRLTEFYSTEMPDAPVRIELPKGSYVPVFLSRDAEPVETSDPPVHVIAQHPAHAPRRRTAWIFLALTCGLLIGAVCGRWGAWPESRPSIDPTVKEFWLPALSSQSRVLICVGNALYMSVRAAPFPNSAASVPAPEKVYASYGQFHPLSPDTRLFMHPVYNAAAVGMISAISEAASTISLAGGTYQVLPERTAPLPSFRGRDVILFGDALNSQAAAKLLDRAYLTVAYDDSGTRLAIRDRRKPASAPPVFSRKEESSSTTLEAYGLITVLPTERSGPIGKRTFVISGISDAGIDGAMEFLISADRLRGLKEQFKRQGLRGIPAAYQVVVKCTASNTLLLSFDYAAHEVIDSRIASDTR